MLEQLHHFSNQILTQKIPRYKRFLYDKIDFDERLIGILGSRGVGKTTLLLQYIQSIYREKETLYITADHPLVFEAKLFAIAEEFEKSGGEVLIIDEIHKIKNFEIDLKLIYDSFFSLKVIFTGSNAVAIDNAKADLSRRAMIYKLPVLSFREYLEIEADQRFASVSLVDLLQNHQTLAVDIVREIKPFVHFESYLKGGAYPFFLISKNSYIPKLLNASLQVIESDLPMIHSIESDKINALKKMMIMLCKSQPFDINISKLTAAVGLNQRTLYRYLWVLESAGLIRIIGAKSSGTSIISKPEKIYLDNTNLFSIFCTEPKIGTIRETFFASSLAYAHRLDYPKQGDFLIDNRYIFEVGGKDKAFDQIKDLPNSFVVADDIEVGSGNKVPLWLFGFLY